MEENKQKTKKVLFVATVVKGHILAFHKPYLKMLSNRNYEVHVAAKNDCANQAECRIPYCDKYYNIPFARSPFSKINIKAFKELKKLITVNGYDLIHCHTPVGGVITRLAAKTARKHGTRVIYTAHGFHFYKGAPLRNWILFYPIEKYCSKYTDILITLNQEDYLRAGNFNAVRVVNVPGMGVNTEKLEHTIVDVAEKRKELNIPENAFLILSVGELSDNKNHEVIIKALSLLNHPNVYYLICGVGDKEKYLKNIVEKLKLKNKVIFAGYRRDVNEIIKAADCFAFPSKREGLGLVAIEAMAGGLPIVTSNVRGINEYSQNGITGFSVSPTDVSGFAQAFSKLYENPGMRKQIGENNKQLAKKYDKKYAHSLMEEIYNSI